MIIGSAWADSPYENVITGCLLKLIISEAPYPTPACVRSTDDIFPLTIGCKTALKSCPPDLVETPIVPSTVIDIGW